MGDSVEREARTYDVHVGYTKTGRDRWRKFDTLEQAIRLCREVFERTKIVLTIVEHPRKGTV